MENLLIQLILDGEVVGVIDQVKGILDLSQRCALRFLWQCSSGCCVWCPALPPACGVGLFPWFGCVAGCCSCRTPRLLLLVADSCFRPFLRTGGGGKKYQGLDAWTRSLDRLTDHMEQPYTAI